MRRIRTAKEIDAGLKQVIDRIYRRVRDSELARYLADKVMCYFKTKNQQCDLRNDEAALLYRDDGSFDESLDMSRKKKLNVDWTSHARYRSELRDVSPHDINQMVDIKLKEKLPHPDHKKVTLKEPGIGTAVIEYDMRDNPAKAEVITVWAKRRQ